MVGGSSLDYVRGEHLISSIIQQITDLRKKEAFDEIYEKIKEFCNTHDINLHQQYHSCRKITIPARFQECIIESTIGQRETLSSSTDFMNRIYFALIDCMLVELNNRFSAKTLSLMKSISTVYPESENFLNADQVDEFCRHVNVDSSALKNEFNVIKSMIKSKTINDIIQFLNELLPFLSAFPQTIKMISNAITMPISQVTCERSFSKLKIIKNYLRNSMTDERLSDLTILSIEREIDINYEQVIDVFSSLHKNSRILLR